MVRSRKQSKRMPAKMKFKIAKKVREHNRKARKEAKKNAKKLKKDPGIPNLFPLKEQILKQMEDRKRQAQSQKEKEKLVRQQEAKKKKKSLQSLQNDALKRTKEFEKKQALQSSQEEGGLSSTFNRRPLRAYHREFRQVVEMADVILEVLDARDPLGTRCVEVEQAVMAASSGKKLVLVLNKIDLVPKSNVEAWLKHLRNEFPTVTFKASTQTQKHHLSHKRGGLNTTPAGVMTSSACLGAELLLKLLGNYCRNVDIRTSIAVGVVGLPNVGKSSIINSLKRCKACSVGGTPGVTKTLQEVQLDKYVKLIDSPGVVMAMTSGDHSSLLLRNCIKVETIGDAIPAVEVILRRCNRLHMMEHYRVPEFNDSLEFLSHLAKRTGKLKKGGVPDINAAARTVLQDWNTGRIKYYTHPPEQHTLPTHISADIVREWGQAFDLKGLESEEKEQLSGLQEKMEVATVVVESQGIISHVDHESSSEEDEEEESDIEEEMGSEVSDIDGSDEDEMEEEDNISNQADEGKVTVTFQKKKVKGSSSLPTSVRERKERAREMLLNPQTTTADKKALRRQQQQKKKVGVKQSERRKVMSDGDIEMTDAGKEKYDFNDYF